MWYVMISNKCNMQCDHCYLKGGNGLQNVITDFKQALPNLIKNHPECILLYGYGEPLYEVDIESLYEFCKEVSESGIKIKLQTNLMYQLTEYHLKLFSLMDVIKVPFDIGIRYKSFSNLLQWFNNLKKASKYSEISLEVTLTKKVIDINAFTWIKFLDHLMTKKYITSYIFHDIQFLGNALVNKEELKYTKEEFVKWMSIILSFIDKGNKTIDEFLKAEFFYKYNIFKSKAPIMDKNGNMILDYVVHYTEVNENDLQLDIDCLFCDNYRYCGGRSLGTECYWDIDLLEIAKNTFIKINEVNKNENC